MATGLCTSSVDDFNAQQRRAECPVCDLGTASLPLDDGLFLLDLSGCEHQCALEQLAEYEAGGMTVCTFKTKHTIFNL